MLSRVAENVYWLARYLERVEDTARLINATTNLLLDLPRGVEIGWRHLVWVTSGEALFLELFGEDKVNDERAVMKFLVGDRRHHSSILSSIIQARENGRVTREIVPSEAWEQVNELYLYAKNEASSALGRRRRYDFLHNVVLRCQTITGLMAGSSSHDAAYQFMRIGRNLERADMSSRILDVGAAGLWDNDDQTGEAFVTVRWMSILKSLSAYHAYRQHGYMGVGGSDVVQFILQDRLFPRAVAHCVTTLKECCERLPNPDDPLREIGRVLRRVNELQSNKLGREELHQFIDEDIQQGMALIHDALTKNYFRLHQAA